MYTLFCTRILQHIELVLHILGPLYAISALRYDIVELNEKKIVSQTRPANVEYQILTPPCSSIHFFATLCRRRSSNNFSSWQT